MKISYLGHAGFQIDHAGNTLVIDPWLSRGGAFLRSWFQYPENHFLADGVAALDPGRSAIYISHAHADHFDRSFLARMDRSTPIVIARFVRRHFVRELTEMGFTDIRELDNRENLLLRGFRLSLFVDESYSNEDSGVLVEADGCRFLNMNDCRAYDAIDFDTIGRVDLFTIQFSGASWFPNVYDYEPERRSEVVARKNEQKYRNVQALIARIAPRLFIPSAGPACFLDDALFHHNFGTPSAFPDFQDFHPWVEETGVPSADLKPGDCIHLCREAPPRVEPTGPHPRESAAGPDARSTTLRDYADRFALESALPVTEADSFPRLRAALEAKAAAMRQPLITRHQIGVLVTGRPGLPDGRLVVNLQRRCVEEVDALPDDGVYAFHYENHVLHHFFESAAQWEDLMLSLRYRVCRTPDAFDTRISDFMRLEAEDLASYPRRPPKGRMCIEHDGVRYEVDRYCPHQGGDLSSALIKDGILTCPRHGWCFDLRNGGKAQESLTSIRAVELNDDPVADEERGDASAIPERRAS